MSLWGRSAPAEPGERRTGRLRTQSGAERADGTRGAEARKGLPRGAEPSQARGTVSRWAFAGSEAADVGRVSAWTGLDRPQQCISISL